MSAHSLKQRALKGATWAAIGGNGAQVLSFVMFVLISRVVGPEAFGAVAVALLLVETARAATIECVAMNLVARGGFRKEEFDAGLALSGGLALAASVVLAACGPLAALGFSIPELSRVLPQIAPILAVHALARMFEAEMTVRMAFRALAFRSLGAVIMGGAAGIAAAYAGKGIEALILQQWVAVLVSVLLLGVQSHWRPGFAFRREAFMTLARQSAVLAPAGLLTNMRHTIDGLAVAAFSGAAAAGVYNLAKRTRLALQLGLTTAVGRVSLPAFAHLKEDQARLSSAMLQAMRLSAIAAFPVFVGVAAVAPEMIAVFLGPEWARAAVPMAFLMIGGALAVATRLCENLLLVCGRRATIVGVNIAALSILAVLVLLAGRHGPVAVAAAVLCVGVFQNIAAWLNAARYVPALGMASYLRAVWGPMTICLLMLALITALRAAGFGAELAPIFRLATYSSIGALFYVGAAWAFARPGVRAAVSATRLILAGAAKA